jgi:hypothetical protein
MGLIIPKMDPTNNIADPILNTNIFPKVSLAHPPTRLQTCKKLNMYAEYNEHEQVCFLKHGWFSYCEVEAQNPEPREPKFIYEGCYLFVF